MAVRALKARIDCDRETLLRLWRTHCLFNERLPCLIKSLFRMRRGECGQDDEQRKLYRTISYFVLDNTQNAEYILNSVSTKGWKPGTAKRYKADVPDEEGQTIELTGDIWADSAARLSTEGMLLYEKSKTLGDVPAPMRQMICREAGAIIAGHDELVKRWENLHRDWLRSKVQWECDPEHRRYLGLRSRFEEFETSACGKATKRRGRWHLYIEWLRNNPDLAAWRGGAGVVIDLSDEARDRVRKTRPSRQRRVESEEFFKVNPELKELDRLHGEYERLYVRRRKTKRNPDGFDHRPTFTMPGPVKHARPFTFSAPQSSPNGYRNLRLPGSPHHYGLVDVLLIAGEAGEDGYPSAWTSVRFKADPRLSDFHPVTVQKPATKGKVKGEMTPRSEYRFFDRQLAIERVAQISGTRLVFRDVRLNDDGSLRSALPYLYFTCSVDDVPLTEGAKKIKWEDDGDGTAGSKRRKKVTVPNGVVTCAVDLGLRNLGFGTTAVCVGRSPKLVRSRNLWVGLVEEKGCHVGRWSPGPDLAHIGRHKRQIRQLRRLRGKPVHGEESHVRLQEHIDSLGEDRFKKGARAIINFALNLDRARDKNTGEPIPRADVLVLEKLAGLIPDAERDRGINRALASWNRGQLVERIRQMAKDVGLKVVEIHPMGTSQVCSKCGALGRRYSIYRDPRTGTSEIRFGCVEKLFACPSPACDWRDEVDPGLWPFGYRANADHNASVNLHRKFIMGDDAIRGFLEWNKMGKSEKGALIQEVESRLLAPLCAMYQIGTEETPF